MGVSSVEVHWSTDFVATVSSLAELDEYTIDRGPSGTVAAKTLKTSDGSVAIVFNAEIADPELSDGAGIELIERTAAHEGAHVLQRAADVERVVPNRNFGDSHLWYIGHIAISEFLVERAVMEAGYPAAGWCSVTSFDGLLGDLDYTIALAVNDPGCARDPSLFHRRIVGAYNTVTVGLAYMAAAVTQDKATLAATLTDLSLQTWNAGLSDTWDARLELYSGIASGPVMPDQPDLFLTATELERATLAALGFEYRDEGFWRTSSDTQEDARLRRAYAYAE
jgi:hypothetical protein